MNNKLSIAESTLTKKKKKKYSSINKGMLLALEKVFALINMYELGY